MLFTSIKTTIKDVLRANQPQKRVIAVTVLVCFVMFFLVSEINFVLLAGHEHEISIGHEECTHENSKKEQGKNKEPHNCCNICNIIQKTGLIIKLIGATVSVLISVVGLFLIMLFLYAFVSYGKSRTLVNLKVQMNA